MPIYGYARVSTCGQTLAVQLDQLKAAGCDRVFEETASGARSDRRELKRVLRSLRNGDVLMVTRLDRLARSTLDLLKSLAIVADHGATFKSLAEPWADTATPAGRLILTVLGGLAEFERHLICDRTSEGRARAKANGVKFGRKPKLSPTERSDAMARRAAGEPASAVARSLNVSPSTIFRVRPPKPPTLPMTSGPDGASQATP